MKLKSCTIVEEQSREPATILVNASLLLSLLQGSHPTAFELHISDQTNKGSLHLNKEAIRKALAHAKSVTPQPKAKTGARTNQTVPVRKFSFPMLCIVSVPTDEGEDHDA